jgi:hypothetical protein
MNNKINELFKNHNRVFDSICIDTSKVLKAKDKEEIRNISEKLDRKFEELKYINEKIRNIITNKN